MTSPETLTFVIPSAVRQTCLFVRTTASRLRSQEEFSVLATRFRVAHNEGVAFLCMRCGIYVDSLERGPDGRITCQECQEKLSRTNEARERQARLVGRRPDTCRECGDVMWRCASGRCSAVRGAGCGRGGGSVARRDRPDDGARLRVAARRGRRTVEPRAQVDSGRGGGRQAGRGGRTLAADECFPPPLAQPPDAKRLGPRRLDALPVMSARIEYVPSDALVVTRG
jgi:hypothetical protein